MDKKEFGTTGDSSPNQNLYKKVADSTKEKSEFEEQKEATAKAKNVKQEDVGKGNEAGKTLHGNKDPGRGDYDSSSNFGNKENAEVPKEIKELEKLNIQGYIQC